MKREIQNSKISKLPLSKAWRFYFLTDVLALSPKKLWYGSSSVKPRLQAAVDHGGLTMVHPKLGIQNDINPHDDRRPIWLYVI